MLITLTENLHCYQHQNKKFTKNKLFVYKILSNPNQAILSKSDNSWAFNSINVSNLPESITTLIKIGDF